LVRAVYAHQITNVKNGRELICGYAFKDPPVNGKIRDAYRNFIAAFA